MQDMMAMFTQMMQGGMGMQQQQQNQWGPSPGMGMGSMGNVGMGMGNKGGGVPSQDGANDWYCPTCCDRQFKNNATCRICGLSREHGLPDLPAWAADKFLSGHNIEPRAAEQFETLPPEMKKAVMAGGSLHGTRDPTAVLISRMSKVGAPRSDDWFCPNCNDHQFGKNAQCRNCGTPRPLNKEDEGSPPDAITFLGNHPIDETVKQRFLSLDAWSQQAIIMRGSLAGARDASAVLSSRMTQMGQQLGGCGQFGGGKVKGGGGGGGAPGTQRSADDWYCPKCYDLQFKGNGACRICQLPRELGVTDPAELDPSNFLTGHVVEDRVRQQYENLPPELQVAIMSGGSLHGARDPTAVLLNRMSKAQCPRDGDWFCPTCGDHQFAKNIACRNCGEARPADGSSGAPPDAETFLGAHAIDEAVKYQFLSLDPASQSVVICRGSLNGTRDPTAVLASRIRDVKSGGAGFSNKGGMGKGGKGGCGGLSGGFGPCKGASKGKAAPYSGGSSGRSQGNDPMMNEMMSMMCQMMMKKMMS